MMREALGLSLFIHIFLTALTLLQWRSLNPTEEALMSPSQHTHTHTHTHTDSLP
ncbi:hypothetical protein EXN66_Car016880 [Channa argus]|uniref:Uncharacterized protein n=1 Tax=Channa argus TaxID=215402 RepID=A0A6G1QF60_CHAAH|nr:hypothetical protein EXN66_Car016880 [Channa argus]